MAASPSFFSDNLSLASLEISSALRRSTSCSATV
jgi:hypothetical protein